MISFFFFFNDTATTEIYTLSLHDALPISSSPRTTSEEMNDLMNPDSGDFGRSAAWASDVSHSRIRVHLCSSVVGNSYAPSGLGPDLGDRVPRVVLERSLTIR